MDKKMISDSERSRVTFELRGLLAPYSKPASRSTDRAPTLNRLINRALGVGDSAEHSAVTFDVVVRAACVEVQPRSGVDWLRAARYLLVVGDTPSDPDDQIFDEKTGELCKLSVYLDRKKIPDRQNFVPYLKATHRQALALAIQPKIDSRGHFAPSGNGSLLAAEELLRSILRLLSNAEFITEVKNSHDDYFSQLRSASQGDESRETNSSAIDTPIQPPAAAGGYFVACVVSGTTWLTQVARSQDAEVEEGAGPTVSSAAATSGAAAVPGQKSSLQRRVATVSTRLRGLAIYLWAGVALFTAPFAVVRLIDYSGEQSVSSPPESKPATMSTPMSTPMSQPPRPVSDSLFSGSVQARIAKGDNTDFSNRIKAHVGDSIVVRVELNNNTGEELRDAELVMTLFTPEASTGAASTLNAMVATSPTSAHGIDSESVRVRFSGEQTCRPNRIDFGDAEILPAYDRGDEFRPGQTLPAMPTPSSSDFEQARFALPDLSRGDSIRIFVPVVLEAPYGSGFAYMEWGDVSDNLQSLRVSSHAVDVVSGLPKPSVGDRLTISANVDLLGCQTRTYATSVQFAFKNTETRGYVRLIMTARNEFREQQVSSYVLRFAEDEGLRLRYVPKSTRLYELRGSDCVNGFKLTRAIPDGIAGSGVSIGAMQSFDPHADCVRGAGRRLVRFAVDVVS